jgi:AcrR family transcriptional regulator
MGSDPLFDTLFRPTAPSPQAASAPPVRAAGTRSRAGNAMNRTRSALLDGARQAVASRATRITMAQVATAAGVAKATLYNHFRTREAVLSALLADEVSNLIETCAARPLPEALAEAADALSANPMLRSIARLEPATLASLAQVDMSAEGWRRARDAIRALLEAAERGGSAIVLRWLASYLMTPASRGDIDADVEILLTGLPPARPAEQAASA